MHEQIFEEKIGNFLNGKKKDDGWRFDVLCRPSAAAMAYKSR